MSLMSKERATSSAQYDIRAVRREYVFALPSGISRLLEQQLKDPRDLPLATCLVNVLLFLPATLLTCSIRSHVLGLLHLVLLYSLFLQRFLLALHYSQHRPIFKRTIPWRHIVPGALTPMFGLPIGSYNLHHCLMHHQVSGGHNGMMHRHTGNCRGAELKTATSQEDNQFPTDVSSTEPYQRDNLGHFLL